MSTESLALWPPRITRLAGALALLVGATVLVGWTIGSTLLKSIAPGWATMSPLTALCLIVSGAALWFAARDKAPSRLRLSGASHPAARALVGAAASLVALIALLRLAGYLFALRLDIDTLLLFSEPADTLNPSRMSSVTSINFALVGLALLVHRFPRLITFHVTLSLFVGLFGWLGLSHYLFGGQPILFLIDMAAHTSVMFLVLSVGLLFLRTDGGLAALLISDSAGGFIARRLVPATLVLPILIGWLRLQGQASGLYGTEAGVALQAFANIIIFGGLIWASAALLDRSEIQRKLVEHSSLAQLRSLKLHRQITGAIGERQDLNSIYQVVVRSVEDDLPVDFCCICLYDQVAQTLKVVQVGAKSQGLAAELAMAANANIPIGSNGLSDCLRGRLVSEPDVSLMPFPFPQRLAGGGLRALIIAPLVVESTVLGVLVAARSEPYSFDDREREFIRELTAQVAVASHQAQLHIMLQTAYDDLRQTQQAVMQQERLRSLGQMASGIAHDINNAITPVSLCAEYLLAQEPSLSARGREYLEIIGQSVNDVAQTVGRMREFYRHREPELLLTPVDLNRLILQVVDLTRARWSDIPQQRGVVVSIETELKPDVPPILGVESEIREALINLVFNGVDAMPAGGTLTLRTTTKEAPAGSAIARYALLEVADSGVGMDEDTRRRCLEPFFTTKGERGTGLGLAMVYGTVKRHGAEIEVDSAVGKGTTVRLTFALPDTSSPATAHQATEFLVTSRLRILLVDDDPLLSRILRETLESDGHQITVASGGQAGIDTFLAAAGRGEPFAVVITDLGMPHVDGRMVASSIKASSPSTPIILLTGWGQRLVAEGDIPPHVDRVMSKPPKVHELRAALADLTRPVAT